MKPLVDENRCQGHGRCYALAPDVFEPDDEDGYSVIVRAEISQDEEALIEDAKRAAEACPERAITLVD